MRQFAGDVACDMYHKYAEDFAMMKQMGIKHYRCSEPQAWGRMKAGACKMHCGLQPVWSGTLSLTAAVCSVSAM
jgi:hypothetical protein